jgi:hypothetical protein
MFVIPRTKHIESRILDLPLPLSPVIELKLSSLYNIRRRLRFAYVNAHHPDITVRTAYDLKPCMHVSEISCAERS